MGLVLGVCAPILGGYHAQLSSPVAFLERAGPVDAGAGAESRTRGRRRPTSPSNSPPARPPTPTSTVWTSAGARHYQRRRAGRADHPRRSSVDRFAHFNFADHMMRPSYGLAEATVFVTTGQWSETSPATHFDTGELSEDGCDAAGAGTALVARPPQSPPPADRRQRHPPRVPGRRGRGRSGCTATTWRRATGANRRRISSASRHPEPAVVGTPAGPWLRTGDLGFVSGGQLFIVGRIRIC